MTKPAGEAPEKRRGEIRLCAQYLTSIFNNIEKNGGGLAEFSAVLGQPYNDKNPFNFIDFQDNLETIKQLCKELIEDPDSLKEKGQKLFRMTWPVVDAWIIDQMPLLSGDTRYSVQQNDASPTPENMVALVDAADTDITREKKQRSNFDLMPVTLSHLCKQWLMMRNEKVDRVPNSPKTAIHDILKAHDSLPVITIRPQGDGRVTLSVQVDSERLPRTQADHHPMEVLREKAAKEFGLPVAMSLVSPSLHWSNCTPDQIEELYPKIVKAFLEKQRSIMKKPAAAHDI